MVFSKVGGLGIGDDGVDLGLMALDPFLDRRQVMADLDAVKGRGLERRVVGAQERVVRGRRRGRHRTASSKAGANLDKNGFFIQGKILLYGYCQTYYTCKRSFWVKWRFFSTP